MTGNENVAFFSANSKDRKVISTDLRNVFSDSHQRQRAEESGQQPDGQDDEVHLQFRNKAKLRILAGLVIQLVKVPHGHKKQLWVTT